MKKKPVANWRYWIPKERWIELRKQSWKSLEIKTPPTDLVSSCHKGKKVDGVSQTPLL